MEEFRIGRGMLFEKKHSMAVTSFYSPDTEIIFFMRVIVRDTDFGRVIA